MADDALANKAAAIERCVARVRAVAGGDADLFERTDPDALTRHDSVVLNLQRACQAAIDAAMRVVARDGLGVPQTSRDAFRLLADAGRLDADLARAMGRMVGFRNVAVHDYQALHLPVVRSIVERHLGELEAFAAWALRA